MIWTCSALRPSHPSLLLPRNGALRDGRQGLRHETRPKGRQAAQERGLLMNTNAEQPPSHRGSSREIPPAADQFFAWTLVGIQAALIAGVVLAPLGSSWPLPDWLSTVGAVLRAAGALLLVWAVLVFGRGITPSPLPSARAQLRTRGPYRWIRHPMYASVMLFVIGTSIRSSTWVTIAFVIALLVFFHVKARWEEGHLRTAYPGYSEYMATTPRFLPKRVRPDSESSPG